MAHTVLKYQKTTNADINFFKWLIWASRRWVLVDDWHITARANRYYAQKSFVVPAGFVTDGGTIPRFCWFYVTPWNRKYFAAYVLHDYLLKENFDPRYADQVFYDMLLDLVCPHKKALNMYHAVTIWH